MREHCGTCRFWHTNADAQLAQCRRYAPIRDDRNVDGRSWPLTWLGDWCGEYEPKETEEKA